eukprot:4657200-Lingulodinium_polyedra.AAC.1
MPGTPGASANADDHDVRGALLRCPSAGCRGHLNAHPCAAGGDHLGALPGRVQAEAAAFRQREQEAVAWQEL